MPSSQPPDPADQQRLVVTVSQQPQPARLFALLLLWDFSSQPPELLAQLRRYIAEDSWARYADRPGLRQKVWFSNQQTRQWGAFYLWETEQAREQELATMGRVQAMTGVAPRIDRFDVEAVQEGDYSLGDLRRAGLALARRR
jgi:Putative mono-oxygenase ydhR